MATFQSQINILAAGQHKLHKRIEDLTDFKLHVIYDSLDTYIMDNEDSNSIKISGLGYNAFDCILSLDLENSSSTAIHFMDYKGLCEDFIVNGKIPDSVAIAQTTSSVAGKNKPKEAKLDTNNNLTLTSTIFETGSTLKPKFIKLYEQPKPDTGATEGKKD